MVLQIIYFWVSFSAHRRWTVHTCLEQTAETALMSCTKWHQSLTDLLASSQQAQVGCSLLSQSLFFVVTVSTAPLRQRKATMAGGQRAGLYSLLHRYKLCFRLRNNSGLKHCKTISSEEGRVAVWDHASYGVTHCTPAQPPTVSILRHPSTKGDTLHNAVTGSLTPRGTPFDFWWVIHSQSFKFQKSWMYTWKFWTQRLWKCIKLLLHNKDRYNLAAGTKILTVKAETVFWIESLHPPICSIFLEFWTHFSMFLGWWCRNQSHKQKYCGTLKSTFQNFSSSEN